MTDIPHILVACTIGQARRTAHLDLGWRLERIAGGRLEGARNKDGELVRFTSSFAALRGYKAEGLKLYLGRDWIFAHAPSGTDSYIQWWLDRGGEVVWVFDKHTSRQLIQEGEI